MCHQSIIDHVYLMFNTCLLENVDVNHQIQKSIKYFNTISTYVESHYFFITIDSVIIFVVLMLFCIKICLQKLNHEKITFYQVSSIALVMLSMECRHYQERYNFRERFVARGGMNANMQQKSPSPSQTQSYVKVLEIYDRKVFDSCA